MSSTESVLFGDTRKRKGLAREAAYEDVVVWNGVKWDSPNVASNVCFFFVEVGGVGLASVLIPLTRKNTLSANVFEAFADTANAGEEVDKCEFCTGHRGSPSGLSVPPYSPQFYTARIPGEVDQKRTKRALAQTSKGALAHRERGAATQAAGGGGQRAYIPVASRLLFTRSRSASTGIGGSCR